MKFIPLCSAAIVAAAIAAAAPAEACSGSADHFLATLESHGIDPDPSFALELAEAVCSDLGEGEAYDVLIEQGVTETGLSHEDFVFFVKQSVLFFCPESTPKLPI